jgi:hypothetical protein
MHSSRFKLLAFHLTYKITTETELGVLANSYFPTLNTAYRMGREIRDEVRSWRLGTDKENPENDL